LSAAGISREDVEALVLHCIDQGRGTRAQIERQANRHNPGDPGGNFSAVNAALERMKKRRVIYFSKVRRMWFRRREP